MGTPPDRPPSGVHAVETVSWDDAPAGTPGRPPTRRATAALVVAAAALAACVWMAAAMLGMRSEIAALRADAGARADDSAVRMAAAADSVSSLAAVAADSVARMVSTADPGAAVGEHCYENPGWSEHQRIVCLVDALLYAQTGAAPS